MANCCRRFKFLKVIFSLIVFSLPLDLSTEGSQFSPNLKNIAVYEGQQNIIMNLTADPNNVSWTIIPSSDEFGSYQITQYGGYRDISLVGLFYRNQSGLLILNATTAPNGEGPISTSGLYIAQCSNDCNRTAAKLLVVRVPPVCSCNAAPNVVDLSCSVLYADGTVHPINANMTWKIGDVVYTTETPVRNRIDYYVFESTSTITVDSSISDNFTCTVAFNAPTDIEYDFIATNAPEFSASCSVEASGHTTTGGYTTSAVPSTTTSIYCLQNMMNIAVREGTLDVTMHVNASDCAVHFAVQSTTDLQTMSINSNNCMVDPNMANLYYVNRSGLVIKNSTTTENGHPVSTAGFYAAFCNRDGSPPGGAKLLVIRSGPACSCIPKSPSSDVNLSCSVTFADRAYTPIPAIMTWIINGAVYQTDSPQSNRTDQFVITATSTITVDGSSVNNYQCILTFGQPTGDGYTWAATNAPEFSASCSTPVCVNGTTQTTTQRPTEKIPISMEPSFGPVAGGTNLTIIIGSDTIEYISRYVGSNIGDIRQVYFGEHLSSTLVSLKSSSSSTFEFLAVTPNTTESSTGQPLPVIIELSTIAFNMLLFNMTSDKAFTYLPNPEITGIYPDNFITSGGTLLDVFGHSLSSVAKPIIQLKVIITRAAEDDSTQNVTTTTTSRVCKVPPGNDTYMQCPMPPLYLPDDFLEIINSLYNNTATRRRRSRDPINHLIAKSHSLLSRLKRDVNVLTVNGSNGVDRADIYLGFILDGYKKYENINDAFPDTRITFYSAPEINSSDELIQFDPSEDELIYVKGRYMSRGCRLIDYVVHIGSEICTNNDLQANQLSCRPPKVEPSLTLNDTIYCGGSGLSMTVSVGYKQYQYSCLTYRDRSRRLALIVGLTVGLGGFVILLIVLIVCIVKCRRKKVSQESDIHQNSGEQELGYRYYKNVEQPESQQSCNVIRTRQNASIYKPDDDYAKGLQLESRQDYDRQIEDDDIKPNDEYSNFYGVDRN